MSENKFYYLFLFIGLLLFSLCSNSTQRNIEGFDNSYSCKCNYKDVDRDFEKIIQSDFYFCMNDTTIEGDQLFEVIMGKKKLKTDLFIRQNSDKLEYFKLKEGVNTKNVETQTFIDFSSRIGASWNLNKFGLFYDYTCTLIDIKNNVYTISLKDNYDVESTELYIFRELKINRNLSIEEIVFNTNGYGHEVRCRFN